jgi:hypothetical protein
VVGDGIQRFRHLRTTLRVLRSILDSSRAGFDLAARQDHYICRANASGSGFPAW